MAKIFYVVEKADDYISAHFFKTEKEALTYGIAEFPDFDMFDEPMEDDENGVWLHGDSIDFKKGILFSFEEGESHVQSMDEDKAREYSDDLGGDGATIFFDKFTKGMYGYLGNGADGKGRKWDWDGMRFNESVVNEKFNFSKKEVEKAANLIASAISQADMVKAKVHDLEYDKGRGAGFEISIDGEKYEGGSYVVKDNGDVVNAAIGNSHPNAVYNTIGNKDIADVFINMEKYESLVNEKDDAGTHLDNLADLVGNAKSFMNVGKELKAGNYKYDFSTGMMPHYQVEADGFTFMIVNKRYVDKGDREVNNIAIGLLESVSEQSDDVVTEGKNDYTARYQDTNINLKKAYKHLDDVALNQLYLEIGELIADNKLKVKDATFTFEAKEVTTSRKKVLMFEEFVLEGDCKCGGNCTCTTTTTNEANADGTISDDEDDDMENFFADVEFQVDELCTYIKRETEKIGGPFRSPGYEAQGIKLVKATFKKHKIKI